ncbi:hypothetical protein [Pantanalinema sp. GBBB05]|uniref:hypothetical protein n=1 Tax=Pantanalinema sp. GBBB05 TaxID=2604139 RepID=UPI001E002A03|nr:hypothetical protein [Pantanalinema sp. GBBB05]
MPKLIIDDEARNLLLSKVAGQPIYSSSEGQFISPGLIDIVDLNNVGSKWQPGDTRTTLLVLGGEACHELLFQAERFIEEAHRKRTIKNMTVPLCSLMDQVHKLMRSLTDEESIKTRETWPNSDQDSYKIIGRQFRKKRFDGPVRKNRHLLGAHLNQDAIHDPKAQLCLDDFFSALGDSLILFNLVINHPKAFSWIRWLGSSQNADFEVVETLFEYPLCVRWVTDKEGKAVDVGFFQLAEDPRWKIQEYGTQTIDMYNTLVKATGSQVPTIWSAPSVEMKIAEQQKCTVTASS